MNCKPGDLAYIVASDFDENIGRIVTVTSDGYSHPAGWVWCAESSTPLKGWADGELSVVGESKCIEAFDFELRPITPEPLEHLRIEDTFDSLFVALGIRAKAWA